MKLSLFLLSQVVLCSQVAARGNYLQTLFEDDTGNDRMELQEWADEDLDANAGYMADLDGVANLEMRLKDDADAMSSGEAVDDTTATIKDSAKSRGRDRVLKKLKAPSVKTKGSIKAPGSAKAPGSIKAPSGKGKGAPASTKAPSGKGKGAPASTKAPSGKGKGATTTVSQTILVATPPPPVVPVVTVVATPKGSKKKRARQLGLHK